MKIDDISHWEAFVAVARTEGFTSAAELLKQTPSQISKRISKLESGLGIRLFQRSTRVVKLTDEGMALLPKIESVLGCSTVL